MSDELPQDQPAPHSSASTSAFSSEQILTQTSGLEAAAASYTASSDPPHFAAARGPAGEALEHIPPSAAPQLPALSSARRRRRSPSSPLASQASLSSVPLPDQTVEGIILASAGTQQGDSQPSTKRRRLKHRNMRLDTDPSTPGPSTRPFISTSPISPLHKAALANAAAGSSQSSPAMNGTAVALTNGSAPSGSQPLEPTYFGHDREEVARILIQSLAELGYSETAAVLTRESGFELDVPTVTKFRTAILDGDWDEAERILMGRDHVQGGHSIMVRGAHNGKGLKLARGADANEMLFRMRQQKLLELLEGGDVHSAMAVLRLELHLPFMNHDNRIRFLSLVTLTPSAEVLRSFIQWDGASGRSRESLLIDLSKSISPAVMMPEGRLATLFQQVKDDQISKCLYHSTSGSPSLYMDHICERENFPTLMALELDKQSKEIWHLAFSHDGTRLAAASQDCSVVLYETHSWAVVHYLREHVKEVAYVSWSPDDSKIITCSFDYTARVWNSLAGTCVLVIDHHKQPVTSASWSPDGQSFVTGSVDITRQLCLWDLNKTCLYSWPINFRIQDCRISPDARRLIVISTEKQAFIYDLKSREEEYHINFNAKLNSLSVSQDSKYILVSQKNGEIHMIDIEERDLFRRFTGPKQDNFVIRSDFGGAGEHFVISGSEDSRIFIWHKENGVLLETLDAHTPVSVNAVAWNPQNPSMFASAGDDNLVRM
ncbi:MAG: hypothetical protein M1829_005684 [Trizodia sp. TS-e1964]|nr:MAG: hypothetical protein M1829_005684 [Trizodia sp. TS-e1964]